MSARSGALFLAVALLWGIPYALIKVALQEDIPPGFVAWIRITLAAGVLLAWAAADGALKQLRGRRRWVVLFAVLELTIPFPLIAWGETRIASSLTAILIASVPSLLALLVLRFDPGERVSGHRLLGLAVGFVGVVALVGIDIGTSGRELLGVLAVLGAATGYATALLVLGRHLRDVDQRAVMGMALGIAAVLLLPLALVNLPTTVPSGRALWALLALGLLSTAAAFALFGKLVSEIGPGRASVITYVAPVFALLAGVVTLGEDVGPGALIGLVLILLGSWLSTGGSDERERAAGRAVRVRGPRAPSG